MFDAQKMGSAKLSFLPVKEDDFVAKGHVYYFEAWIFGKDKRVRKHRFSAENNPKKERILYRFVRRAIKCRRYSRINPLAGLLEAQAEVFELYRRNVIH